MKRILLCLSAVSAALCAPVSAFATEAGRPAPVLLVSIDGFRADYLARGLTPNIARLALDGVGSAGMRPSFPSSTFPNHYTLVTGRYPDHHGIVNNTMRDPARPGAVFKLSDRAAVTDPFWWEGATPLWVSAQRQGKVAATMFWPGSETPIHGVLPDEWLRYDAAMPYSTRVDTVLSWLSREPGRRPDFATLYFEGVDSAGHEHGPDSPQVGKALEDADAAVGRLLDGLQRAGLKDRVNLLIVADHGMAAVDPDHAIELDKRADPNDMDVINSGAVAGVDPKPGKEERVLQALSAPMNHGRCMAKSALPASLHYGGHARVPAIVCIADPGWYFTAKGKFAGKGTIGMHGYDPAAREMNALFVAHGPAFRKGVTLPAFGNVDLYPLMARLVGIHPEPNDGNAATFDAALTPVD
ncbi:alkaline phosphatase family protein [Paludibacterium paludis]|nr:ectonucleotide pyrophosphatase/phosphodiesterase [Paludibacterium paludis]